MFNCKVKDNIIILIIRYVYLPAHCRKKRIERECDKYVCTKKRDEIMLAILQWLESSEAVDGGRLDCNQTKSLVVRQTPTHRPTMNGVWCMCVWLIGWLLARII